MLYIYKNSIVTKNIGSNPKDFMNKTNKKIFPVSLLAPFSQYCASGHDDSSESSPVTADETGENMAIVIDTH